MLSRVTLNSLVTLIIMHSRHAYVDNDEETCWPLNWKMRRSGFSSFQSVSALSLLPQIPPPLIQPKLKVILTKCNSIICIIVQFDTILLYTCNIVNISWPHLALIPKLWQSSELSPQQVDSRPQDLRVRTSSVMAKGIKHEADRDVHLLPISPETAAAALATASAASFSSRQTISLFSRFSHWSGCSGKTPLLPFFSFLKFPHCFTACTFSSTSAPLTSLQGNHSGRCYSSNCLN